MKNGVNRSVQLVYKDFKHKKSMFLLETIIVMMVIIIIMGSILIYKSMWTNLLHTCEAFGTHHATFVFDKDKNDDINYSAYDIESISFFNEIAIAFSENNEKIYDTLKIIRKGDPIYYNIDVYGHVPTNKNEIMIPERVLNNPKVVLKEGDIIQVSTLNNPAYVESYLITGFYSLKYGDYSSELLPIISIGDNNEKYEKFDVRFNSEFNIREKCERLSSVNGIQIYEINEYRLQAFFQVDGGKINLFIHIFICLAIIILCYSMIRSVVFMRFTLLTKEYAILRSFGVKKKKLHIISLTEIIGITFPASFCGIIITIVVFYLGMIGTGIQISNVKLLLYENVLTSIIISILVVFILESLAYFLRIKKINKKNICDLFNTNINVKYSKRRHKSYKAPVRAYIFTSLSRNKWKTILSIILFASAISFFVFSAAYNKDSEIMFGTNDDLPIIYDAEVTLNREYTAENNTEELLDYLNKIDGVKKVKLDSLFVSTIFNVDYSLRPYEYNNSYILSDGIYKDIHLEVYSEEELNAMKSTIKYGSNKLSDGECILVNYAYPLDNNGDVDYTEKKEITDCKVGDDINIIDLFSINNYAAKLVRKADYNTNSMSDFINKCSDSSQYISLKICGIADSSLRMQDAYFPVIIISEEYYEKMADVSDVGSGIFISLEENVKLFEIKNKCREISSLGSVEYFNINRDTREQLDEVTGLAVTFMLIAFLVGVITIISTIILNWEMSRMEYSILRSVGASVKKVIVIIMSEKAIICISSFLLGTVLGITLERLLVSTFVDVKNLPFTLPIKEIVSTFMIMILITLVSTWVQSKSLLKSTLSTVLKE